MNETKFGKLDFLKPEPRYLISSKDRPGICAGSSSAMFRSNRQVARLDRTLGTACSTALIPRGKPALPIRMSSTYRVVQHMVNCCHTRDYIAATAHGDNVTPKLSVKQYIPIDNPDPQPGDVTIIGAHANGFPKVWPMGDMPHNANIIDGPAGTLRTTLG